MQQLRSSHTRLGGDGGATLGVPVGVQPLRSSQLGGDEIGGQALVLGWSMVVGRLGRHGVRMRIVKRGVGGIVRMRMVNLGGVEGCDCGEVRRELLKLTIPCLRCPVARALVASLRL